MARYLFWGSGITALDTNGDPAPGALMNFYQTNTTTPVSVYAQAVGGSALSNPVVADSAGRFVDIFLDVDVTYRAKLTNAANSDTIFDVDPISPGIPSGYATYATLAGTGGADLIGKTGGGTLQDFIDAFDISALHLTPEMYGALGDGSTNDNAAMVLAAAYVSANGGGIFELLPSRTYIVGAQTDQTGSPTGADGTGSGNYRYTAHDILHFENCDGLIIRLNGSTLQVDAGLKHGAFNADGTPMASANGYTGVGAASAYGALIFLENCTNVLIENGNIDGNSDNLENGGPWGDTGWQVGGTGLQLNDCSNVWVNNLNIFGNPSDGIQHAGACEAETDPFEHVTYNNVSSTLNGRNNLSIIGGKGLRFVNCDFSFAGKGDTTTSTSDHVFQSSPAAGCDVETEGAREAHYVTFEDCRIACNYGSGFLYAGGGASNFHMENCSFIGDINYCFYSAADFQFMRVMNSRLVGNTLWQGTTGDGAAKFIDCDWFDATAFSPTGDVYDPGACIDLGGGGAGTLFDNNRFYFTGGSLAPAGTTGAVFRNTFLEQASGTTASIGGAKFEGINDWTGTFSFGSDVNVYSTANNGFTGKLLLNSTEASVQAPLANFHGLRVRGYTGAAQANYKIGRWSDPVDWATNISGAAVGDIVFNTTTTAGAPLGWECITAPGDASNKWRAFGGKGIIQGTAIVDLGGGATLSDVITKCNALFAILRTANIIAT